MDKDMNYRCFSNFKHNAYVLALYLTQNLCCEFWKGASQERGVEREFVVVVYSQLLEMPAPRQPDGQSKWDGAGISRSCEYTTTTNSRSTPLSWLAPFL
ncbi:hypothetical protein ACOMHN_046277 [Nucella lapillus]